MQYMWIGTIELLRETKPEAIPENHKEYDEFISWQNETLGEVKEVTYSLSHETKGVEMILIKNDRELIRDKWYYAGQISAYFEMYNKLNKKI